MNLIVVECEALAECLVGMICSRPQATTCSCWGMQLTQHMHSRLGIFGLAGEPSSCLSFTRIRPSTQKSLLYALRCMPGDYIVWLQALADVQHHSLSDLYFSFQAEAFHTAV